MSELLVLSIAILILLLISIRLEIAFAVGIGCAIWIILGDYNMVLLTSRTYASLNDFVLLAIPLFMLVGELMNRSNITEHLIAVANATVGRFRGGLAQANIAASLMFAGISGSASADTAAIGSVFIPAMEDEGYTRAFAAGITASSSAIGPIIPPSISLVIYGGVTGTSVGALFIAAIIPGLIMAFVLAVITFILAIKNEYPSYESNISKNEYPRMAFTSTVAMFMPILILGGIAGGFFTATEAAGAACAYAVFVGALLYRNMGLSEMYEAVDISMRRAAQIYIIIGVAAIFSYLIAAEGIPEQITATIEALGVGQIGFFLIVTSVLIIAGMWLPSPAAIVLLAPTLADMSASFGIEPLQFGTFMVVALLFGLITPPLGLSLFVAASVAEIPVWPIAKVVVPYYVANFAVIGAIIFLPELTLYLPRATGLL